MKENNEGLYNLTDRELAVVRLICNGISNKEISIEMMISEETVKKHITSILKKTKLKNREQLIVYFYKNNLLKVQENRG